MFITGYYLSSKGTKLNLRRIVSFVLEIHFLSVCIFVIFLVINKTFNVSMLFHSIFPLLTQHFWYPFNYVVLLLLSPYLNFCIEKASRKGLVCFILLLVGISCIFLKINVFYSSAVFLGHSSHSILWWVLLYTSAAYYRRYGVKHTTLYGPVLFLACFLVGFLVVLAEKRIPLVNKLELQDDNAILGWLTTYSSFITFQQFRIKFGGTITRIMKYFVPSTFVVYIFQEHCSVRNSLWNFVNVSQYAQEPAYKLLGVMVLLFLGIWTVSTILYCVYLFAKKLYLDRICLAVEKKISKHSAQFFDWLSTI